MSVGHQKPLQLFGRSVAEWHKTHETKKNSNYVKLHSRLEPSSPNGVDLTSRKVGLQIRGAPFYLNRTTLHGGDTPHSGCACGACACCGPRRHPADISAFGAVFVCFSTVANKYASGPVEIAIAMQEPPWLHTSTPANAP